MRFTRSWRYNTATEGVSHSPLLCAHATGNPPRLPAVLRQPSTTPRRWVFSNAAATRSLSLSCLLTGAAGGRTKKEAHTISDCLSRKRRGTGPSRDEKGEAYLRSQTDAIPA